MRHSRSLSYGERLLVSSQKSGTYLVLPFSHFYPGADERFPALLELPRMPPLWALGLSGAIYMVWQTLYWKAGSLSTCTLYH